MYLAMFTVVLSLCLLDNPYKVATSQLPSFHNTTGRTKDHILAYKVKSTTFLRRKKSN